MKRIILFTIIILALFSMLNSLRSIYSLWKKRDVLIATKNQLKQEQEVNRKLKEQLKIVSSQEFVEQEARNKLFLVKPGESTVFIPDTLLATAEAAPKPLLQLSNWQQWWRLFFN